LVPAISYCANVKHENGHGNGSNPSTNAALEQVADSMVILEYLEERFALLSKHKKLLPESPATRAHARFWCVHINERIIPHFYKLLMAAGAADRDLAQHNILGKQIYTLLFLHFKHSHIYAYMTSCTAGLRELAQAMAPASRGPFFLGEEFSMVDIVLVPWFQRSQSVLKFYRQFEMPTGE
jgi:glutathione S-transferase